MLPSEKKKTAIPWGGGDGQTSPTTAGWGSHCGKQQQQQKSKIEKK